MFTCVLSRFSGIWLFVTLWAVVGQIFLSMGSTRQKYWSGLPFPPLGDLPDPGIEPATLRSPSLAGKFFTGKLVPSGKPLKDYVLVAQSCPTLRDPLDCSLPGSSVHGILQARIQEWVAISSSSRSSWHRDETPGLLHCRQIPYHQSHQGSPNCVIHYANNYKSMDSVLLKLLIC